MYGWSVALGTLHSLLLGLSAWWLFFVVTFPWENLEDPGADDWLILVALVMFGAGAIFFLGIVVRFPWLVVPAFVVGAAAGVVALRYGLVEWSDHGDEELVTWGVFVAATGFLAMLLSIRAARDRRHASRERILETHDARL